MAAEKPVVAFDNGGISEMVIHEQTGLLAKGDPPDVLGLASAIVRYVRDPALAREHGRMGRRRVLDHFDALPHANRIADELRRAAGRSHVTDARSTQRQAEDGQ
jgi:glycosyltransferase involved in cell wall biosynthesis